MPYHEEANRIHKAVLWPLLRRDRGGKPVYDTMEEIDVRWDESTSEVTDNQGTTVQVDATAVVDRRIAIDSLIWKGESRDLPADGDFSQEEYKLMAVKSYSRTPDYYGRTFYQEIGMSRYGDKLPTGI